MTRRSMAEGRVALHFGRQKINLHPQPSPIDPKAAVPSPGTEDLCFLTNTPIADVVANLRSLGIAFEVGPCPARGALAGMTSICFRDPDENLIEVSNYQPD